MLELTFDENDLEARLTLWNAIIRCSELLEGHCSIFASPTPNLQLRVDSNLKFSKNLPAWKMMEALCLLTVLLKADRVATTEICNIFNKVDKVHIFENGELRFLWSQPTIKDTISSLSSRPDIVITVDINAPSKSNIHRIIECKCVKKLGTQVIRSEFGKAFDLKISSYTIWSFYTPSQKLISGAKELGIDLEALWIDAENKQDLRNNPDRLLYRVAMTLDASRRNSNMFKILNQAVGNISDKLLSS